jgi:hypothetical protein
MTFPLKLDREVIMRVYCDASSYYLMTCMVYGQEDVAMFTTNRFLALYFAMCARHFAEHVHE